MDRVLGLCREGARPPPSLEVALAEYAFHDKEGHAGAPPVELEEAWFYRAVWQEFGIPMHIAEKMDYRRLNEKLLTLRVWERAKNA